MTTGALIFAFNNEHTDYVRLAAWNAKNIRRHLNIPVAIVTDCTDTDRLQDFDRVITACPESGGNRWFDDYQSNVTWYNASRVDSLDLTPWDRTLVLDADYVVASDHLDMVLSATPDFLCFRHSIDITRPAEKFLNTFGRHQFPMWWATVMVFNRTTQTEFIFDSMKMIRANWQHYRDLYGIESPTYRNDFALSIALGIVSGHTMNVADIPWKMASALPEHKIEQMAEDAYKISYINRENQHKSGLFSGLDFHAMGKQQLEAIVANSA